jgi:signal transduction histidine kinase
MMPGIRGLEASQRIRELQPDVVCVLMTAYGTMDLAIQALKLGFSEFLVKPFKTIELTSAVNRALENERLRRENARLIALLPLFELNKTLMTTVQTDELARKVLHTAYDELRADVGVLMLFEAPQGLYVEATLGLDIGQISADAMDLLLRCAHQVLQTGEKVLVERPGHPNPTLSTLVDQLEAESLLLCPLLSMDEPVGALALLKSSGGARFAPSDIELVSVFCGQVAIALDNASLFEQTQRAYQELKQLDHLKSEFINIAAHELRTPLSILMGHAELLGAHLVDPEAHKQLQIIMRSAGRLRDLIEALLDMRHLQMGEDRVELAKFNVADVVLEVLEDLAPMAQARRIETSSDLPDPLSAVHSDKQKVRSALSNLLRNALKFTPPGGEVGVEVREYGPEIWVTVWDTGIGIDSQEFERIFDPFYQAEPSLTRKHEGMGLGLSIAKGMVELCGGRIWVDSELGEGSRFTFTIPIKGPPQEDDLFRTSAADDPAASIA